MGMCICFLLHLERHIKLNISRPSAASEGSESEKDLLLFLFSGSAPGHFDRCRLL